jgi:hypothetical protein
MSQEGTTKKKKGARKQQTPSSSPSTSVTTTSTRPRREAAKKTWKDATSYHSNPTDKILDDKTFQDVIDEFQATWNKVQTKDLVDNDLSFQSYRRSLKQALARTDRRKEVVKALKDEIKNMEINHEVMKPVKFKDIPEEHKSMITPSSCFSKTNTKLMDLLTK